MAICYLGIDLGGTNVKAGLVEETGVVRSKISIPTEAERGPDHVIDRMILAGKMAIDEARQSPDAVRAIGIGAPGALNHKQGVIVSPPNLPGWRNVPVRDRLSGHFGLPATLENDANAAAWGEFWVGAGRTAESLVMFTLGTGVGGGIVSDGKFIRGFFDNGAEIGHMIIEPSGRLCNCGQRGCLEAYASASHTARIATDAILAGRESSMKQILDRGEAITTERIVEHMGRGDALATETWQQTCRYIAIGCINLTHIINPEMIILSGGMVYAGDTLLVPVRQHFEALRSPAFESSYPQIVLAELGNDAGFIGAAGAAKLAESLGELA
ncbi:MAG: ROK family glucokinase [Phycisphaerae bacterium]|nr:ROK family glucokinase [Phycisphaerae bacterium]